jgi:3-methyladenine DNA glycosylase AlkD
MITTRLHGEVRKRLRARASSRVRIGAERYFKHQVRFHGVPMPALRAVARRCWPRLETQPTGRIIQESVALLRSPYMEERQVGVEFLHLLGERLPAGVLRTLGPVFDEVVSDWGTCDGIAGRVFRDLVRRNGAARRTLLRWSLPPNPWRRRAAAVAFVTEARRGRCRAEVLRIAARLARQQERFSQLGMGWLLREYSHVDRGAVMAFLARHRARLSREALRYAIEHFPEPLRARVLRAAP